MMMLLERECEANTKRWTEKQALTSAMYPLVIKEMFDPAAVMSREPESFPAARVLWSLWRLNGIPLDYKKTRSLNLRYLRDWLRGDLKRWSGPGVLPLFCETKNDG